LPEVGLGLLPGAGGTQRLPRLAGVARSLPLLLEGSPVDAQAMRELGVFDEVVPVECLLEAAHSAITSGRAEAVCRERSCRSLVREEDVAGLVRDWRERVLERTRGLQPAPLAILDVV